MSSAETSIEAQSKSNIIHRRILVTDSQRLRANAAALKFRNSVLSLGDEHLVRRVYVGLGNKPVGSVPRKAKAHVSSAQKRAFESELKERIKKKFRLGAHLLPGSLARNGPRPPLSVLLFVMRGSRSPQNMPYLDVLRCDEEAHSGLAPTTDARTQSLMAEDFSWFFFPIIPNRGNVRLGTLLNY
mmetsp:Transcript_10811/g.32234  ORF Transcript_10811/g.32234 Transcript_10811/m.32234 type:complete len:185 (+) Transcript_10811:4933-5487(+)